MSKSNDWIKLHRSILQSNVFDNPEILKVWIWVLCKANWGDTKFIIGTKAVDLKAGQMVFGRNAAARDLQMNESKVYRIMKILEALGNIKLKPNNKFTVVTVVNWGFFQSESAVSEQQENSKRTADEQQLNIKRTTNEHTKRINKKNKEDKEYIYEHFERIWQMYPRKKGKNAVSEKSMAELYEAGIEIVNKAIENYKDELRRNGTEEQFIMYGSTFFNGRWKDYVDLKTEKPMHKESVARKPVTVSVDDLANGELPLPGDTVTRVNGVGSTISYTWAERDAKRIKPGQSVLEYLEQNDQ